MPTLCQHPQAAHVRYGRCCGTSTALVDVNAIQNYSGHWGTGKAARDRTKHEALIHCVLGRAGRVRKRQAEC